PCHYSLHLFAKTNESQHAGIVQKLSDQALRSSPPIRAYFPLYHQNERHCGPLCQDRRSLSR
ncbi:hypothetical protein FOH24_10145, partial [Acetobacter tropicalis]